MYEYVFQFFKFFTLSFFFSSLTFSTFGVFYALVRSVTNKDILNDNIFTRDIQIFFQVLYEITTNIQKIAHDISLCIGTWLLVTDNNFQDNFDKIVYEEKYNQVFDKYLKANPPSNDNIEISASSILVEHTPIGNVVMYYDIGNKCLTYYSSRSLTTNQLQSIGRKFIIQFCCSSILIEMQKEKEEKNKPSIEDKKETTNEQTKQPKQGLASKSGVIAKFKRSETQEKEKTSTEEKDDENKEQANINYVNMFRFVRKGTLADFSFTQKIKMPKRSIQMSNTTTDTTIMQTQHSSTCESIDKSKMSFSEYKRLIKMKQENTKIDQNMKLTSTQSLA